MQKSLLTPNGGAPLFLDDLKFIEEASDQSFKDLLKVFEQVQPYGLDSKAFVLQGCEISMGVSTFDVSPGIVAIDGEILQAQGSTAIPNANLANMVYRLETLIDPTGNDIFEDGVPRDKYQIRRAELVFIGGSVPYTILPLQFARTLSIQTLIASLSPYSVRDFTVMSNGFAGDWVVVGATGIAEPFLVTKQLEVVRIQGRMTGTQFGIKVSTLSAGFRPRIGLNFLVPYGDNGIVKVEVAASGDIYFYEVKAPDSTIILDLNISFSTEGDLI